MVEQRDCGKEWRKSGGRVSRILQQCGKEKRRKRKGEKKCSLRDSHCSSCDRMRSAEANVWRIKRSCSSQLVQKSVARRQNGRTFSRKCASSQSGAGGGDVQTRPWKKQSSRDRAQQQRSKRKARKLSYTKRRHPEEEQNRCHSDAVLMILGHSLSATLLLLIQDASISDQKQLLLMILTCICPSVLIQEESSNQRLMMRMLQFTLVFIQNTAIYTIELVIVEGLARTS